jgi:cytochrome c oxidase subunit 1
MHVLGIAGMIRHTYDPIQYGFLKNLQGLNVVVSYAAFALAGAQLIFIFNFIWSFFRGPNAAGNPWKANTLEWTAPSPIPHGNWNGQLPTVYRWPYDYGLTDRPDERSEGKPGAERMRDSAEPQGRAQPTTEDYLPQNRPVTYVGG